MKSIKLNLKGYTYLSDILDEFPFADKGEFRFFHKGETGCGGTTFVKSTTDKIGGITIVLMPSVASVKSKQAQYFGDERAYFIYGGIMPSFDRESRRLTVFATYDSYWKIKRYLNDYLWRCRLVVDEYHCITRDSYREVMTHFLSGLNKYKSVTFLSATPDECMVKAIMEIFPNRPLTEYVCDFGRDKEIQLYNIKTDFNNKICDLINRWTEEHSTNLYLMYNRLDKGIDSIIKKCGLKEEDYNILCSDYNSHKNSGIEFINNNIKRINFLTAAGFEGVDILDPNGEIVCALDLAGNTTIYDIQTIIQMMGRCRGSHNTPTIIYRKTKYRAEQMFNVNLRHQLLEIKKHNIIDYCDDSDIITVDGACVVNPICYAQVEREKIKMEKLHSYESFTKYLTDNGIKVNNCRWTIEETSRNRVQSFKEACKLYESGKYSFRDLDSFVKKAYEGLGAELIHKLKYNETSVRRALEYKQSEHKDDFNVFNFINGQRYTSRQIVERIKQANIICGTDYSESENNVNRTLEEIGFRTKVYTERVIHIGNKEYTLDEVYNLAEGKGIVLDKKSKNDLFKSLQSQGIEVEEKIQKMYYIIGGGKKLPKREVKLYKKITSHSGNNFLFSEYCYALSHNDGTHAHTGVNPGDATHNHSGVATSLGLDENTNQYLEGKKLPKREAKLYKKIASNSGNNFQINSVSSTYTDSSLSTDSVSSTYDINPGDYKVSYATKPGVVVKTPKFNVATLSSTIAPRPDEKTNQYLISEGYSTTATNYHRAEFNFDATDTLILDVDNGTTIEEFNQYVKDYYGNAFHWITKTYSYTDEKPKYRVIFPLTETLYFKSVYDVKAWKKTKFNLFDNVQDPQCQMWVFAPIDSLDAHGDTSVMIDTDAIVQYMDWWKAMEKATNTNIINLTEENKVIFNLNTPKTSKASVEKEIDRINSSVEGERDNKIFISVMRLKNSSLSDIYRVYNGIYDDEKQNMFKNKVYSKLRVSL